MVSTSYAARWRLGRGSRRARSSPGVYEPVVAVGRRRPAHATMPRWTTQAATTRSRHEPTDAATDDTASGPWTRRRPSDRLRERLDHRLARRRDPPDGAPGSTASSISPTWRRACWPSTTRPRAPRRPAPLHARRLLLGDPRRRGPRTASALDGAPSRAARGDRRGGHRMARAGAAPSVELASATSWRSCSWRRASPTATRHPTATESWSSAGCRSTRSWR